LVESLYTRKEGAKKEKKKKKQKTKTDVKE